MNKQIERSFIVPLLNIIEAQAPIIKQLVDLCEKNGGDEIVFVVNDAKATQPKSGRILEIPKGLGRAAAIKRGLFDAKGRVLVVIEDLNVSLSDVLSCVDKFDNTKEVVLGVKASVVPHKAFDRWVAACLADKLCFLPCMFRIIRQKDLGGLLGRIYLEDDGFDVEWAYVSYQLGYKTKVITVDGSRRKQLSMNFKMFWDVLCIRIWHFPKINTQDEHMSDKDVAQMYENESHHWWFVTKAAFMRKILQQCVNVKNPLVLDAGCGTGHNMRFLGAQGPYVGLDVSSQALKFCQANGHTSLVRGNLDQLPFKANTFDVVLSLDVIEHTRNPWAVVRQLKDTLKENGQLIITVPACRFLFGPHDEALSHLRRYNPRDVRTLLEEAGFEIKQLNYLFCLPFLPVAIVRILHKIFARDASPSTDMYLNPVSGFNGFMTTLLKAEVFLYGKIPMPFGTTLVAVAVRK